MHLCVCPGRPKYTWNLADIIEAKRSSFLHSSLDNVLCWEWAVMQER